MSPRSVLPARLRRRSLLAVAAGTVALAAFAGPAVTAGATPAPQRSAPQRSAPESQTLESPTPAGSIGTRAQVPWSKIGPGWELAEYTTATVPYAAKPKPGPTELYLVNPAGAKYLLYTWPSRDEAPYLLAWSGDKKRVLLNGIVGGVTEQLTLATGKISELRLGKDVQPIGYTRPTGLNILGEAQSGRNVKFIRYTLAGKPAKVLSNVPGYGGALYTPNGSALAISTSSGLGLVSNAGGKVRELPVPGSSPLGCVPERWWKANVVLASCFPKSDIQQLWLVPVTGARPTALTPPRSPNSPDLGDIGAWALPSGLYLQALGGCGTLQVFKQAASGSISPVNVPGTLQNNRIITAIGAKLLISAQTGCPGSQSLLWFNPATHAEQWLLRPTGTQIGVEAVVPYYSAQDAGS